MKPTLRTASPLEDEELRGLIDAAFHRPDRESRLAVELARVHPGFDPGLSLVGEVEGEPAGWTLFLPRAFRIRGAWVPMAAVGPYGTLPRHRGQGVQRVLFETGLAALGDRSLRGAVAIGEPQFLERFGFRPAFNHYTVHVPLEALPEEGDTSAWVGLTGEHLPALVELHHANHADVDGSERRVPSAGDWASYVPDAHTLVLAAGDRVDAYLRFRIRERLEIPECGVRTPAAIPELLRFLRRLAREHARELLDVHVPPPHPVARALFHLGCPAESSNLGGGAMLRIVDWEGLLHDTAPSWRRALECAGRRSCSLELGESVLRLVRTRRGLRVERRRDRRDHVVIPPGMAESLLTGQRDFRDLLEAAGDAGADEGLLRELFPGASPAWTFAPVFELAAE